MAIHTNLPIYKVAYDLLDVVTDLVKNMPRDFKSSIGGKISQECVEIVVLIFRANCARDKAQHLGELMKLKCIKDGEENLENFKNKTHAIHKIK